MRYLSDYEIYKLKKSYVMTKDIAIKILINNIECLFFKNRKTRFNSKVKQISLRDSKIKVQLTKTGLKLVSRRLYGVIQINCNIEDIEDVLAAANKKLVAQVS